ncbi:MAG TPA: SAM-dependent chlorinase/fluorinase [Solirubrobacteraceae bacterium]
MTRIVTFLSDYGAGDEFAGVVHGVIARLCPAARVIDLGHGVPPQDVRTGARRLARALPFAPAGVHLAVVDPGVGGPRRAVALRTRREDRLLVGPDNGLLMEAAERFGGVAEAVEISESPWRLEPVSATFHGRDIFAPVAAELAADEPLAEAGEPLDPFVLVRLEPLAPVRDGDALVAHVAEVDGFGNLVLDAAPADYAPASLGSLRAAGRPVVVGRTFGDAAPGGLLLYADAGGSLALAVNGGSAAALLGLRTGDEVRLES